ncbi:unnamed protein product [Brassica oleracea var. botrytis]
MLPNIHRFVIFVRLFYRVICLTDSPENQSSASKGCSF